jgi:hypothetical protein
MHRPGRIRTASILEVQGTRWELMETDGREWKWMEADGSGSVSREVSAYEKRKDGDKGEAVRSAIVPGNVYDIK